MAVDLANLVEPLRVEVNPPGSDLFPDASDEAWLGALTNAFWEVRLYGLLSGFEENASARNGPLTFSEGIVTPTGVVDDTYDDPSGYAESDLGRELQQLIVLWAGWKVVLNRMGSLNTMFRAKAGPVEFETQSAATVLKTILDQLKSRIDLVLLSVQQTTAVVVFDAMIERSYAQAVGYTWWVRS